MPSKEMTPKFDGATTCPDKKGVFAIRIPDGGGRTFYSYWNGERWGFRCSHPQSAYKERWDQALGPVTRWWGFVEKQK